MNESFSFSHGGALEAIAKDQGLAPSDLIDFSSNLNPLGPPAVIKAAWNSLFKDVIAYPDSTCSALRSAVAKEWDIPPESIVAGNGSTELIYLITRAWRCQQAVILGPTFSEYARACALAGIAPQHMRLNIAREFAWEPTPEKCQGIASAGICFICNPNNPSGSILSKQEILHLVANAPKTLFVVDEAFIDFVHGADTPQTLSVLSATQRFSNLLVLRSFTKYYALAGLRLGFAIAHPTVCAMLEKFKEPWTVNALAQSVGQRLMGQRDYVRLTQSWLAREYSYLWDGLQSLASVHAMQSHANYFLIQILASEMRASDLFKRLLMHRVVVRNASNFEGLDGSYIRVAIRQREDNARLLEALQIVLSEDELVRRHR